MPELTYGSAREIRRDVLEMVRPPQETTVAESAERSLKIVNPSGPSGNWSAMTAPYMVEPMNLARSRLFESVVFMGPARSGKTVALVDGVLAYSIVDDHADCMVVQTSKDASADFSKMRMRRAIRRSPELMARLSPRSHDDNDFLKVFRSGMAIRFGWPSIGQLSGKDLRRVLMTDVDNINGDLGIDEAFGLALKRTQTYMSAGICIAESSPARDYTDRKWRPQSAHEAPPADGIAALYNRGDRRLWYWPCPECKAPFAALAGISLFKLPPLEELRETMVGADPLVMAEQFARICCPACGVLIDPKHKRWMNERGRWVSEGQRIWPDGTLTGEPLRSRMASFWLGGVAAAYQPWVSLVERYLQAVKQYATTGETKPLKTTVNVDQAMPFIPPSATKQRCAHELQQRCEDWTPAHVPPGVRFLTAQVDIQGGQNRRFVVQVIGWGAGREHWVIDRYALKTSERIGPDGRPAQIDPSAYVEDWRRLIEKCIERRYPLDDGSGRTMPVRLTVCDSGGEDGVTSRAYEFHRYLVSRRLAGKFRLVKGASSRNAPRVLQTYPDAKSAGKKAASVGDVPVLMLNTTDLKDTVASDLARESAGPGYWHFPQWLPTSFYGELTAEERGANGWVKVGGKNESVDLCAYGEAAFVWLGGDKIKWDAPPPWAADWDHNPDVRADDDTPPQAPTRRPLQRIASNYLGR